MNKFIVLEKKDGFVDYDIHFAKDLEQAVAIVDHIVGIRLNKPLDQVDKDDLDEIVEVYSNVDNEEVKNEYFM